MASSLRSLSPVLSILVTGATGKQGGAVTQSLLHRGHRVRALTRNPGSPAAARLKTLGAELVGGSMEDRTLLERAMRGLDAVFAVTTPFEAGVQAEIRQGTAVADAAQAAGVRHLVYASVPRANTATGVPYFESKGTIERHIAKLGVPHTIVAPCFFMDNLSGPYYAPGLHEGRFAIPLSPGRKLQMICVADIAAFSTLVLEQRQPFLGQRIDLASDELTPPEIAHVLSEAIARKVSHYRTPIQEIRAWSKDLAAVYEWFDRVGTGVDIGSLLRRHPDMKWRSLQSWADAQAWGLLAPAAR